MSWKGVAMTLGVVIGVRLLMAPYWIYQDQQKGTASIEALNQSLVADRPQVDSVWIRYAVPDSTGFGRWGVLAIRNAGRGARFYAKYTITSGPVADRLLDRPFIGWWRRQLSPHGSQPTVATDLYLARGEVGFLYLAWLYTDRQIILQALEENNARFEPIQQLCSYSTGSMECQFELVVQVYSEPDMVFGPWQRRVRVTNAGLELSSH